MRWLIVAMIALAGCGEPSCENAIVHLYELGCYEPDDPDELLKEDNIASCELERESFQARPACVAKLDDYLRCAEARDDCDLSECDESRPPASCYSQSE